MLAIAFPPIDPVLVSIGPFSVHWYSLAYVAGFVLGLWLCKFWARRLKTGPAPQNYDDFLVWAVVGTIIGGRLGYISFYHPTYFWMDPLEVFRIWTGGMSFHGGMLGVIVATFLFCRKRNIPLLAFSDILACVAPIGLFLGRLANFVNGELYGRPTDVAWGVVFPRGGDVPRHPSQLYEALLEGLLLFIILNFIAWVGRDKKRAGVLSGLFLFFYGTFRFGVEFYREPDEQLGFLYAGATMGQMLSFPMIVAGGALVVFAFYRKSKA